MKASSMTTRRSCLRVLVLALAGALAAPAFADEPGLTFFGWSDQHVTTKGE